MVRIYSACFTQCRRGDKPSLIELEDGLQILSEMFTNHQILGLIPDDMLPPVRIQEIPQKPVSHIDGHQAPAAPAVLLNTKTK